MENHIPITYNYKINTKDDESIFDSLNNILDTLEKYDIEITSEEFLSLTKSKEERLLDFIGFAEFFDNLDDEELRNLKLFINTMYEGGKIDGFPRESKNGDFLDVKLATSGATTNLSIRLPMEINITSLIHELLYTPRRIVFSFEQLESTIKFFSPLFRGI